MLDQESHDAGQGGQVRGGEALYTRPMPGGGYVRVEVVVERVAVERERRRGRIVIEPRALARHGDAAPIVVEELDGDDENEVLERLFRIARDNAALARRVLRRRSGVQRAD